MPKSKGHTFYKVRIRIRDVGDEPLALLLMGIAQHPLGPDNSILINERLLREVLHAACLITQIEEVCSTLKQGGECTVENFSVLRESRSDPNTDSKTAQILEWLV